MARVKEAFYRDKLASSIEGSVTEVRTAHGSIDVLAPTEVIEVKRLVDWKAGVGQLNMYGMFYPNRVKRLHVLMPSPDNRRQIEEIIRPACSTFGIIVTTEYECDRAVVIYKVGDREFRSLKEVETEVRYIRLQYRTATELEGDRLKLLLAIVNMPDWSVRRFGGPAVAVRVVPDVWKGRKRTSVGHFQAKGEGGKWLSISISNYIECVPKHAEYTTIYIPQKNLAV